MKRIRSLVPALAMVLTAASLTSLAQEAKDLGLQLAENPPMQSITRQPPPLPLGGDTFEVREGFSLIQTLEEFRNAVKKHGQKVRMKPGIYRAQDADAPVDGHEHIFSVTGSNNYFDLRGVVIETPVSVQSQLSGKPHVSDTWHIFGDNNTFEGIYVRNVIDRPYPDFHVTENEFEIIGNGTTFRDCVFVIQGSIPYGYSDYYGKGGPNFGGLNKHSFLSISKAKNTSLIGCRVFQQSFGHCVHFHGADGVLIEKCFFTGALRPTNDIFRETTGRAKEYDFRIMYRGPTLIPHDEVIPLTEDGIRSYGGDKTITVIDTTVERFRGGVQLHCVGDVTLENVAVLEAGNFGYDVSSGDDGKVVMKYCRADLAYNPVFNLTRGKQPKGAFYEVTILDPPAGSAPTPRTSLGIICGEDCTFILRDGTKRPLPAEGNQLHCGGRHGLTNSIVKNYTAAKLVLNDRVRNCVIESVGPVEGGEKDNKITKLEPADEWKR